MNTLVDVLPNPTAVPHSVVKSCSPHHSAITTGANPNFDEGWLAVGAEQTVFEGEQDAPRVTETGGTVTVPPAASTPAPSGSGGDSGAGGSGSSGGSGGSGGEGPGADTGAGTGKTAGSDSFRTLIPVSTLLLCGMVAAVIA